MLIAERANDIADLKSASGLDDNLRLGFQYFAHLIFNTYGIAIFWPLKRIPIWMAKTIGRLSGKSKLIPIIYVLVFFFVIPGVILYFTR